MNKGLRRRLMQHWDKLTDADLDRADVEAPRLLALLRERYGYAQHTAERELLQFLDGSADWIEIWPATPHLAGRGARPARAAMGARRAG